MSHRMRRLWPCLVFLAPLGQKVTLVPVTLDMQRIPQNEHLLSTALCALTRLQE